MTVPVVWWTANPDSIARGYWDQALLERMLSRDVWRPPLALNFSHHTAGTPEGEDIAAVVWEARAWGAVFVVPGGHNAEQQYVDRLLYDLAHCDWWLLILTGDEERSFPIDALPRTPRSAVWATSARPLTGEVDVALGFGLQPAVWEQLDRMTSQPIPEWDVAFVGQDTHERRHAVVEQLAHDRSGMPASRTLLVTTSEFGGPASPSGQGLTPESYAEALARTMVAPAPSGPVIPDSFRLFEALEAGAVPIADTVTPADGSEPTYWNAIVRDARSPFPVVNTWEGLESIVGLIRDTWPREANRCGSWWAMHKRWLTLELDRTVRRLMREAPPDSGTDEITVVITTSPAPLHPSTADVETVISSVRAQLPTAEILIAADGVRPEQTTERGQAYEGYLRALIWVAQHEHNVAVVRFPEWGHQAHTTRETLRHVVTPLVLFLEHDTPLQGPPIDWDGCGDVLHSGAADLIRFHHESHVLEPHEHLMVGDVKEVEGVQMRATVQWSQRPHLVRTLWYREQLDRYFGTNARTMIEDVMHGVVDYHWRTFGLAGWEQFRLWLYHQPDENGSIQRSGHLDSRGSDPKYPMVYAYDGDRPAGAPNPTRGRGHQ